MNSKIFLCLLLALCLMLCLCACGNTDSDNEVVNDPTAENNAADATGDQPEQPSEDPSEETPAVSGTVYTVTVTDEGGNPVAGAMLQMCQGEICLLPASTDANGVVTFTVTEDGAYEAKFLSLPAGYEYATEEEVFPFNGATELTIVLKAVA